MVEILHAHPGVIDAGWSSGYLCAKFRHRRADVRLLVEPPPLTFSATGDVYDYRAEPNEFTAVLIDAIDQATQPSRAPLPSAAVPTFDPNVEYDYQVDHEPPLPEV